MKPKVFFILFTFALFSLLGFLAANQTGKTLGPKGGPNYLLVQPDNINQRRLLMVNVDDRLASEPKLISAWVVIVTEGSPASLTFKAVYPSTSDNEIASALEKSFSLDKDQKLAKSFLEHFSSYNLQLEGYIIADYTGLNRLKNAAGITNVELAQFSSKTPNRNQLVLLQESNFFDEMCNVFSNDDMALPWSELVPDHIHFEMNGDVLLRLWSEVSSSNQNPRCEIAPLN